jgi:hypothetical protein
MYAGSSPVFLTKETIMFLNRLILIEMFLLVLWVLILFWDTYSSELRREAAHEKFLRMQEAKNKAQGRLMYSNYPYEGGDAIKSITEMTEEEMNALTKS